MAGEVEDTLNVCSLEAESCTSTQNDDEMCATALVKLISITHLLLETSTWTPNADVGNEYHIIDYHHHVKLQYFHLEIGEH